MKTLLISLSAAAALAAAAAPAMAQDWRGGSDYGRSYNQRQDYGRGNDQRQDYGRGYNNSRLTTSYVDSLDWKITNAAQTRVITWREAEQLRAQFRQVQNSAWRVQNGQASPGERQRLETVVNRIEMAVNRYGANDRRGYGGEQRSDWRR